MTTNEYIVGVKKYGWKSFDKKLWQRNYYEHIIRNETELNKIHEYIICNPVNWKSDENYLDKQSNQAKINKFEHEMAHNK